MARLREETNDGYALRVAGPCMDARLGDEGLLGASLGRKMWRVREGGVHVSPALVIGHGLAMEDGGFLANTAALGLCFLLYDYRLWLVVLLGLVACLFLFDAIQEAGLLLTLPCSPRTEVGAVAVDDVQVALVLSFAFEVLLLDVGGADGVHGGTAILVGAVEVAKDGGRVGVDGGIDGVAEDGVGEMLCLEGMVGHSLLLNVAGKRVLVEETIPITEWILGALHGQEHVVIGYVDVHLCVCWTCDERGVGEEVLR